MGELPEIGVSEVEVFEQEGFLIEVWSRNGVHHRIGGPAVTYYDPETAKPVAQVWKQNGLPHRDGAPAHIRTDPVTDIVTVEEHYHEGKLHRVGGPARLRFNRWDSERMFSEYYRDGERVSSKGKEIDEDRYPRFPLDPLKASTELLDKLEPLKASAQLLNKLGVLPSPQ